MSGTGRRGPVSGAARLVARAGRAVCCGLGPCAFNSQVARAGSRTTGARAPSLARCRAAVQCAGQGRAPALQVAIRMAWVILSDLASGAGHVRDQVARGGRGAAAPPRRRGPVARSSWPRRPRPACPGRSTIRSATATWLAGAGVAQGGQAGVGAGPGPCRRGHPAVAGPGRARFFLWARYFPGSGSSGVAAWESRASRAKRRRAQAEGVPWLHRAEGQPPADLSVAQAGRKVSAPDPPASGCCGRARGG